MSLSNPVTRLVALVVSLVGAIGGVYYAYRLHQEKKNKLPEQWREVGYLKSLYVYPIKSTAPIILEQGECAVLGLKNGWIKDRHLMIVDAADNNFITARAYPELLTIQPSFNRAVLTLRHPDMEPVEVNLAEVLVMNKMMKATVWKATVPVYDCGEEVNKWITQYLNREERSYRLVYYASQKSRPFVGHRKVLFKKCRKTDTGAFPDQLSYNLISETSLIDLNSRLKDLEVSAQRFRPNFYISGVEVPYDEDNWNFVKIGDNIFEVIKPCRRCIITNIDPETGIRNKNHEPLITLRSYRLVENQEERKAAGHYPRMGLQMALRSGPGGIVSENDRVYVS